MNRLIIIRGPLGVGKTTIAKEAAERLGAVYLSIDEILSDYRLDQVEDNIPVENFILANKIISKKFKDSNKAFVVDGNFYYREQLDDLLKRWKGESEVFTLKAPLEVCIKRDAGRKNPHGEGAAKAVHSLVYSFDYGTIIPTENLNEEEVVRKILDYLK